MVDVTLVFKLAWVLPLRQTQPNVLHNNHDNGSTPRHVDPYNTRMRFWRSTFGCFAIRNINHQYSSFALLDCPIS